MPTLPPSCLVHHDLSQLKIRQLSLSCASTVRVHEIRDALVIGCLQGRHYEAEASA
jgi:hypothetical protein